MTAWQPSLFGLDDVPRIDPDFGGVRRVQLDPHSWIDYLPNWLSGHVAVFEHLRAHTRWRSARRPMYERVVDVPRLLASLPDDGPGHPALDQAAGALARRYGPAFDQLSMALYRDGRDSVAFHGDKVLRTARHDSHVATLSLGERRRFLVKPRAGGRSRAFTVGWGDLVVMGGACQRDWVHGVPKVSRAGPRLAVMFRCRAEAR